MNSKSVDGLFQYDEATGAYSFNSRTNFAQFDSRDDTFTLYDEIFTPNFIMYPFGNFMPFNDIVHDSKQVSQINEAYFKELMLQANYLYQQGGNDEYTQLAYAQLAKVLGQFMDYAKQDNWGDNWTAERALQHYFYWGSELPSPDDNENNFHQISLDRLYSLDYDVASDFYFGMEMKMNFMQPKGGLTGKDGQQPMEFYFTGDDDVWVYLDGRLFLDLSGIHRHVGGEIDFVNGEVKYYSLNTKTGDVSTEPYKTVSFRKLVSDPSILNEKGTFQDYTSHSFNFYYMERGSGSSVCRLNFNFPLLRQNSISVKKDLSVDEADKLSLLGNPDFRFQVLKENGEELFIGGNTDYHIYNENNENIGTGTTDANGVFTIKANQMAVFGDIHENSGRYFVRELLNPEEFSQYGTITVDGSSTTTKYDVTVGEDSFKGVNSPVKDASDGSTIFSFNNQITFKKLGSLEISKKLNAYEAISPEPEFRFQVRLDDKRLPVGTAYTVQKASGAEAVLEGAPVSQAAETRTVSEEGIIILKAGETARISNIIAGSRFTVTEEAISSEGYHVTYQVDDGEPSGQPASGVIKTEARVSVLVTNTQKGGTSVDIPITKLLEQADGAEHTYSFTLVQVKGAENEDLVENGTQQTITVTIPPAVSGDGAGTESSISTNTGKFSLTYLEREMTSSQETYYYLIAEKADPDPGVLTKFDDAVYLAEITVVKTDDGIQASAKKYKKSKEDGKLWEEVNDSVSFTNRLLQGYELPETGGMGTRRYTFSGIAWMAIVLMYDMLRRRRKL
ncbi:MAG: FctA domain-containing protein [Lachnospiraceae bacterium]|nr:FctA domain-containing protein [Lachnospiraceae bacterium]